MSETPEYDGLFGNDDELSLSRTFIPPPPPRRYIKPAPLFEPQPTVNELKRRIIELTQENNTLRNRLSKYEPPNYIYAHASPKNHCNYEDSLIHPTFT